MKLVQLGSFEGREYVVAQLGKHQHKRAVLTVPTSKSRRISSHPGLVRRALGSLHHHLKIPIVRPRFVSCGNLPHAYFVRVVVRFSLNYQSRGLLKSPTRFRLLFTKSTVIFSHLFSFISINPLTFPYLLRPPKNDLKTSRANFRATELSITKFMIKFFRSLSYFLRPSCTTSGPQKVDRPDRFPYGCGHLVLYCLSFKL